MPHAGLIKARFYNSVNSNFLWPLLTAWLALSPSLFLSLPSLCRTSRIKSAFAFWHESEKHKLPKHQKNFLSDQLWSLSLYPLVSQGLTRGRLCLPEARWSREVTATVACTMRPAAVCLSTGDTRRLATTNTAWWTTCTDTTSTQKHGKMQNVVTYKYAFVFTANISVFRRCWRPAATLETCQNGNYIDIHYCL